MAGDDLVLVFGRELTEVTAPTPYAHNQVAVLFRILLGSAQCFSILAVELQLLAALHEHGGADAGSFIDWEFLDIEN